MERLTTLLALALLLPVSNLADGQTTTFTVAGDVANPRTLVLQGPSADQPVFVSDLLQDAGIQGDGSAVIVRGEPPQPIWSEWVSARIAGRGSQLANGDIVIFHGAPGSVAVDRHIVVVAGSTRGVAQLADAGSHLGNLLASLGVAAPVGIEVPIIRTVNGSAVRQTAGSDDLLNHGDVVLLTGSSMLNSVAQDRITQLFAQIAELEMARPFSSPIQTVSDERHADTPRGVRESGWITLPRVDSQEGDPAAETSQMPVMLAAVETIVPADNSGTAPETTGVAPDGDLLPDDPVAASVSPLWNGVFVFGLLGSIILILTGWLKTHRENAALKPQPAESKNSLQPPREIPAATDSMASSWEAGDRIQSAMLTSELTTLPESGQAVAGQPSEAVFTTETAAVSPDPSQIHRGTAVSDRLVEDQEWFGANWRSHGAHTSVFESLPDIIPANSDTSEGNQAAATAATQSSEADAETRPTAANDLEDLLQNRLPVELQQADLPYRVTLFGRPAGPRRLRIDAAHSQIAAPRFLTEGRSRQASSQKDIPDSDDHDRQDAASLDRALNSLHEQGH
jgi:hypothetical protein